ncbi:Uncharacterised protein [Nocardia otitidiscaviarum]|uniref:PE domain-containing protein n=1 Tax=Nocardia otitidiscaviarum TaxID=1823 RepID=A0A379JHM5_9NOCA|nr:hypothetical protein [Nocardia otitidiscaviarum]SUD47914.1 Uncharacterised protein [Nocardia otitidiscaviarum]
MTFEVNPEGLRAAAGALALLSTQIDSAPHLGAEPAANGMLGSSVGSALVDSDPRSRQAKDLLKARFNQFSAILALSAETYSGTDMEIASRLAAITDINSGAPPQDGG